jgi:hypothetical protein
MEMWRIEYYKIWNFKDHLQSQTTKLPYSSALTVKSTVKITQNFVAFSEYCTRAIITRGLYTFYPLFEVHLSTVTFGLMYG